MQALKAPCSLPRLGCLTPLPARRVLTAVRSSNPDQQPVYRQANQGVDADVQQMSQGPPQYAMPISQASPDGSNAMYAPPGYQYQQMPRQGADGQYYMPAAPQYYMAPPPPVFREEASSGAPWFLWVGVGVVVTAIFGKVQEFMRSGKTPQQMMAEMAMKQMMGSMGGQNGAGASPFGQGMPPGFPGGMPPGFPGSMPPGFPSGGFAQPAQEANAATVDVSPSTAADKGKGNKFASRLQGSDSSDSKSSTSTVSNDGSPSSFSSGSGMDVVEPIVKEPLPTSNVSSRPSSSFFADAASTTTTTSSSSNGTGTASTHPPGGETSGRAGGESGAVMSDMMENMLRNPEMQKMLYPYLPEAMRNPSSIEWMLNNPEVKKQMSTLFEQQNMMSPQMMDMMKGMDFNQDKVNKQFQELGLKPEDVISKVMANPELASGFSNPKVQAAIMDISANPMNIMKYQSDPEVMKVLEQVTTLFQPDVPPNKRS